MLQFKLAVELLIIFLITFVFALYLYYLYCFTYWRRKGVPSAEPRFPFGDIARPALGRESLFVHVQSLYNFFKNKGHKHAGLYFFNGPIFFPIDPQLIKRILVTDFNHFVDRGMYVNEDKHPLTGHMFSVEGDRWRSTRAKFTPIFTTGKMRSMFNILTQNTSNLVRILTPFAAQELTVDIKDYLTRLTVDNIGCCVFGIDCNSLDNADIEFNRMVTKIFNQPNWKLLQLFFEEGFQNPGNLIKISHSDKVIERFFYDLLKNTIEYREKNNVERDDFLNILQKMKAAGSISLKEIVAESFLFFTAGYETSSSTMSYCIHELTLNQKLQDEIRAEIHKVLGKDSSLYNYDGIMALNCLDRAVKETLRKYPTVAILNRICVKDYEVPDTDVVIEKGTPVVISTLGLHRDPEFFPDPLKFDPERFVSENGTVPFTYLPFGDGPRNCIGLRFGLMQAKLGLATLLCNFKFYRSSKTPRELEFDKKNTTIVLNSQDTIYAKMVKV